MPLNRMASATGNIYTIMHTEMIEHSYIRQDTASHVLTKTTDEIKDYYTETYINGVIGEGMI